MGHVSGIIWGMSGHHLEHVWGIFSRHDLEVMSVNNGQQWKIIRGATCICDAVFIILCYIIALGEKVGFHDCDGQRAANV